MNRFSNEKIVNELVKTYSKYNLINPIWLQDPFDHVYSMMQRLFMQKKLSEAVFDENHIIPISHVIVRTRPRTSANNQRVYLFHICDKCNESGANRVFNRHWLYTTYEPGENIHFMMKRSEINDIKSRWFWCNDCQKPLFDWYDGNECPTTTHSVRVNLLDDFELKEDETNFKRALARRLRQHRNINSNFIF